MISESIGLSNRENMLKWAQMKRFLLTVIMLSLGTALLAKVTIVSPRDRTQIFYETISLNILAEPASRIFINDQPLQVAENGQIQVELELRLGKNYVQVRDDDTTAAIRLIRVQTFPDIEGTKESWRNQIIYLATLGLIEGLPDGNFYPDRPISREEWATWQAKAWQLEVKVPTQAVATDVAVDYWRAPYIKAALEANLLTLKADGSFGLDEPVGGDLTRRGAVAILARQKMVQSQLRDLFNFKKGYNKGTFCRWTIKP